MKTLLLSLCLVVTACGGTSKPEAAAPAAPAASSEDSDSSESKGIEASDVAWMNCYEGCLDKGPDGATAGWADKTDDERKAICTPACREPAQ